MLSGTKSSASTRASGLICGDGPGTLCGPRGGPLMRAAVGLNASVWWEMSEGERRRPIGTCWSKTAVTVSSCENFHSHSVLSNVVWEVRRRGVAPPWLNGKYMPTSASGWGWRSFDWATSSIWPRQQKVFFFFMLFVVLHLEFVESLLSLGETKPSVPSSSADASPRSLFLPWSPSENQLATANSMFKCFCLGPQVVYARALGS